MIRAWRYRQGGDAPEEIGVDPLPEVTKDTLLWIDCDDPSGPELEMLGKQLALNEFVVEDLENGEQRTKLDHYSDHFHIAVHDCELSGDVSNPTATIDLVSREIDIVFGDGWLLSVRQPDHGGVGFPMDEVKRSFERQRVDEGTVDEGFLLWAILDVVVDRYFLVSGPPFFGPPLLLVVLML